MLETKPLCSEARPPLCVPGSGGPGSGLAQVDGFGDSDPEARQLCPILAATSPSRPCQRSRRAANQVYSISAVGSTPGTVLHKLARCCQYGSNAHTATGYDVEKRSHFNLRLTFYKCCSSLFELILCSDDVQLL